MASALNNLKRVDMPLNKETKPNHLLSLDWRWLYTIAWWITFVELGQSEPKIENTSFLFAECSRFKCFFESRVFGVCGGGTRWLPERVYIKLTIFLDFVFILFYIFYNFLATRHHVLSFCPYVFISRTPFALSSLI